MPGFMPGIHSFLGQCNGWRINNFFRLLLLAAAGDTELESHLRIRRLKRLGLPHEISPMGNMEKDAQGTWKPKAQ
jgi:hypothetical protein